MKLTKLIKFFILALTLLYIVPYAISSDNTIVAKAATIKLTKKNLTLEVGRTETLKLSGAKKNITWSSSNKSVATVKKTGQVTAIKEGSSVITATFSKKKYSCKVTVKKNQFITNAPYEAKLVKTGDFVYVIPSDWSITEEDNEDPSSFIYPTITADLEDHSSVDVEIQETDAGLTEDGTLTTGDGTSTFINVITFFEGLITQDEITESFTEDLVEAGIIEDSNDIKYTDYKTDTLKTDLGTAYKVEFNMAYNGITRSEAMYFLCINNYFIYVLTDDLKDDISPDAKNVGEYILKSLQLNK